MGWADLVRLLFRFTMYNTFGFLLSHAEPSSPDAMRVIACKSPLTCQSGLWQTQEVEAFMSRTRATLSSLAWVGEDRKGGGVV